MTEILLIMIVMLALVIEANMILYFTKRMESIKKKPADRWRGTADK